MAAAKKAAASKLRIVAPLVQVDLGGRPVRFSHGDVLPEGVSDESVKHLASLGYVEEFDAPDESDSK
jgi:hypothetical protein